MESRVSGEHPKPKRRILSVDDEQTILYVRELVLRAEGYEVLSASDGQQAIALFEKNPIDLVLLDHSMPGESGDVVAHEIKKRNPAVPIIMVSANPSAKTAIALIASSQRVKVPGCYG